MLLHAILNTYISVNKMTSKEFCSAESWGNMGKITRRSKRASRHRKWALTASHRTVLHLYEDLRLSSPHLQCAMVKHGACPPRPALHACALVKDPAYHALLQSSFRSPSLPLRILQKHASASLDQTICPGWLSFWM